MYMYIYADKNIYVPIYIYIIYTFYICIYIYIYIINITQRNYIITYNVTLLVSVHSHHHIYTMRYILRRL